MFWQTTHYCTGHLLCTGQTTIGSMAKTAGEQFFHVELNLSIQRRNWIYFDGSNSLSSCKMPPLSSLSKQAGIADDAEELSSAPPPSLPSREQARDGQKCRGAVVRAAANATVIALASKGQSTIPRCHCPRHHRHHRRCVSKQGTADDAKAQLSTHHRRRRCCKSECGRDGRQC